MFHAKTGKRAEKREEFFSVPPQYTGDEKMSAFAEEGQDVGRSCPECSDVDIGEDNIIGPVYLPQIAAHYFYSGRIIQFDVFACREHRIFIVVHSKDIFRAE